MKKFPVMITVAVGAMIFLSACLKNNNSTTNPQQGYFMVANVSPDAPGLNITVNGSNLTTSALKYGTYTPYFTAAAGSYSFSAYNATSTSSTPVLTSNLSFSANTVYSYFLVDSFKSIKASFITDNIIAPSTDSVYIRFFNFSPNVGAVNLKDSVTSVKYFTNRTFNDQNTTAANTVFARYKAGSYTFQLQGSNIADTTVKASKKFSLDGGHVYTIFAKGLVGGNDTTNISLGQIINY